MSEKAVNDGSITKWDEINGVTGVDAEEKEKQSVLEKLRSIKTADEVQVPKEKIGKPCVACCLEREVM